MAIKQREVYLLPHPFDSKVERHPFIILSSDEANEHEDTFIAVMITSSDVYRNDFSFDIRDGMFEKPLHKSGSHVRMHLLTLYLNEDITANRINIMKEFYFRQLMAAVGDLVFGCEFKPLP